MKVHALIVLIAIIVSVLGPPSLPLMVAQGGPQAIGALDVCHSSTPALSSTGDMPCMNVAPCKHCRTQAITYITCSKPLFTQILLTLDTEHPPKA